MSKTKGAAPKPAPRPHPSTRPEVVIGKVDKTPTVYDPKVHG